MSTVTVVDAGATQVVRVQDDTPQVVRVQAAGPQGPPGPLGPWLGIISIGGRPGTGEAVFACQPGETLQFAANLAGWHVAAKIEADAEAVAHVYVDDVVKATITWAAQTTAPALATVGGAAFTVGPTNWFEVRMPVPYDQTLADISVRMAATRP